MYDIIIPHDKFSPPKQMNTPNDLFPRQSLSIYIHTRIIQAALDRVEKAMGDAKTATSGMLEPDSDDEDSVSSSRRSSMIVSPATVTDQDLAPLVSAAKKARVAGGTTPQVCRCQIK